MNHFGDVKYNTIGRVANALGMEIGEVDRDGETWYFLHDFEDADDIIYGPTYNNVPVDLDDIADFLINRLDDMDPDEVDNLQNLWKDYTDFRGCGDFGAIFELCNIIRCADDLDNYNLFDLRNLKVIK